MHLSKLARIAGFTFLFFVLVSSLYAYSPGSSRLGVGFGLPNYVIIYRPGNFDFKGGYDFTEGNEFIYLSGGYRFVNQQPIAGPLHFSLGAGAFGKFTFGNDDSEDDSSDDVVGGFNIPIGASLLFFDDFAELFVEVAPGFDLYPKPSFTNDPLQMWAGITLRIR